MTTSAEEKIKPQFDKAEVFSGKLAAVKQKGKWGIVDRSGKWIVPAEYEDYKEDDFGRKLYKAGKEYVLQVDGTLK